MTDEPSTSVSTQVSAKPLAASVREKSTSELMTAIRGPDDRTEIDALILERANRMINQHWVPDWTPQERAEVLEGFRSALRDLPIWAVKRGFSEWERTMPRRASPAEIRIQADRAMQPIKDEIAYRRKTEEAERQAREEARRQRPVVTKEAAAAIMARAGFDPERTELVRQFPTAPTIEHAQTLRDDPHIDRHWSDGASPEQLAQLAAARDANPLIAAARADAERQRQQSEPQQETGT